MLTRQQEAARRGSGGPSSGPKGWCGARRRGARSSSRSPVDRDPHPLLPCFPEGAPAGGACGRGPRLARARGPVPVWKLPGKLLLHPGLTLPSLVGLLRGLWVHHRRGLHWGAPFSRSWKRGRRSQSGPEQQGFPDSAWRQGAREGCEPPSAQHAAPQGLLRCQCVCVCVYTCACTRVCAAVRQAWL